MRTPVAPSQRWIGGGRDARLQTSDEIDLNKIGSKNCPSLLQFKRLANSSMPAQAVEKSPTDIASPGHWEALWGKTARVPGVSRFNYYDFRLAQVFKPLAGSDSSVLEVGCGGSRWIGHFASLGCETWGIDYSPEGLALTARSNLGRSNVHLVAGDFFDLGALPTARFDLIYSLGFIEHFTETEMVTRRMAELLRPGGRVMTLVPNFLGAYGVLQEWANQGTFLKHVIMSPAMLDQAHSVAGLEVLASARFFGCFAPGVVDYGRWQRVMMPPLRVAQHLACWGLRGLGLDRESQLTSPYIVGTYRRET